MRDTKRKEYEKNYIKKKREDPLWIEKNKERQKKYKLTEKAKQTRLEYNKNYRNSYKGRKIIKISEWKTKYNWKETDDRFEFIFNKWYDSTNCELCNKEFIKKNDKCADHEHNTGTFRSVCCNNCNTKLAVVDRKRMLVCLEIHRYFRL
tara:strand:- start:44 stop:490 length:447 start_codon:yes stop_codon:yes gene_type:complete